MSDQEGRYKQLEKQDVQQQEEIIAGKECPKCHCNNDINAAFCEKCGFDFTGKSKCPKCGSRVQPGGDICETCGAWLLENQCKFCYAQIEEGQTFCEECGNPTAGIVCPICQIKSIFDFCPKCNKPLSNLAYKKLEDSKSDPEIAGLISLIEEMNVLGTVDDKQAEAIKEENIDLTRLKDYLKKDKKSEIRDSSSEPLFSPEQRKEISKHGEAAQHELDRIAEEKRKAEEERRRREDEERRRHEEGERRRKEEQKKQEELLRAIQNTVNKRFSDNQEARRYFGAIKPPNTIGWLCNYSYLHSGPQQCSLSCNGGRWVMRGEPKVWNYDVRNVNYVV